MKRDGIELLRKRLLGVAGKRRQDAARTSPRPQSRRVDRLAAAEMAGDITVIDDEGVDLLLSIVGNASEPANCAPPRDLLGPVLESGDWSEFDDPYDEPPITEEAFHKIRRRFARSTRMSIYRRRCGAHSGGVGSFSSGLASEAIRAAYNSGDESGG